MVGGVAADHADGQRLGDVFRDSEQLGHRLERLAEIVLIEARDDDAFARRRGLLQIAGSSMSKNCPSSIADDLGVGLHGVFQLAGDATVSAA